MDKYFNAGRAAALSWRPGLTCGGGEYEKGWMRRDWVRGWNAGVVTRKMR